MGNSEPRTTDSVGKHQSGIDVLERVSDGVVALDHDLRCTYVNTPAAEILDTDAESLLGEYIWDVFPNSEGTIAQDAIERAVETSQMTSFKQYNHELETWLEVNVHTDETGVTIFFSDISEQKERLYELERAETLCQNAQDGLFVIDVENGGETFRISQVNPVYEEFTGASATELKGKTIRELAGEDSDSIREKYRTCVNERESLEYEEHLSAFDGGSWWETSISPVLVGDKVTQIVGATRNITDRKERERYLQTFEQMVEHTGHAVFFTDVDGEIEYVNPAFEDLTGYRAVDVLGETPNLLNSGEHDDAFFADLWETVLDGDVWSGEIVNERKDGTRFVANHTIAPVTDETGEVTNFVAIYDDITDRKEREQRLQTHEIVVQAMNEAAVLIDSDKRIRFANDAALDFADVSLDAIKGQPIGPVLEELAAQDEDPRRLLDAVDALLEDEQPDVGEWVREPDGSETLNLEFDFSLEPVGEVYAEQRLVPVELYDGERGVVGISRDVTARREKEEEIQTHLDQAQEIGQVGSWHLDIDTGDLHWSDECYRIFGLEPGTPMTYARFLESVHPDDRQKVDKAWNEALEDGDYDIEHRIVVDGETRWVQETADVEFRCDGTPESGIGVVQDITERVRQTREIRAQKRRYESLFNSVSGAIVVTDPDGHITTCNSGFTNLFGYDSDQIEGEHISTITDDSTNVKRLLEKTGVSHNSLLVDYQKSSGRVFPGETRSSPLRTHDDDIRGHVIHITDISEARANSNQLQVLSRVFRHNIKNDMNVVMAQAQLIQEHGSETSSSRAEKIFETSRNFVEMAENQQKITELLTGNSETVDVDLASTARQVVSDVQTDYPDATLQTNLATECRASTTPEIGEAVRELIQNAIVHSENEHPSVDIHLRCTETMAELRVRDDGPGIPEQEWHVLEADGEIGGLNHGTGLGLWFVNQIVRRSNGTISFDTNDTGGTTVTVCLPTG